MRKISVSFLLIVLLRFFINLCVNISSIKPVQGCYLQKTEHINYVNVSGEFENQNKTNIILSYPACIDEVFVAENQYVNQGQALFSLDTERMQSILEGNIDEDILSQLSYEDIYSVSKSRSNIKALDGLQQTIYASSSGIITNLNIYPGAVALRNKNLLTINSTDSVLAKFTMSQTDYGKIKIGDSVDIVPVAFSNSSYTGVILDKNAVVKKQSTVTGNKVVIDVFASIINPDKRVAGGLQINGKIHNGEAETINTIDYSYIYQDERGEYVYILKHGVAHKVYVTTGVEAQNYTEIVTEFPEGTIFLSGNMDEGDRVILTEKKDESV